MRRRGGSGSTLVGYVGVVLLGVVVLSQIPIVFPDDADEGHVIPYACLAVTLIAALAAIIGVRSGWRHFAAGVAAGYVTWLGLFILWYSAGP